MDAYVSLISEGKLPVLKGYLLNEEEQITREVISELMCNYSVHWADLSKRLHLPVDRVISALNYNTDVLQGFADDGIIKFDNESIAMLPDATPFVRNVAASIDKLMLNTDKQYSKSI